MQLHALASDWAEEAVKVVLYEGTGTKKNKKKKTANRVKKAWERRIVFVIRR